MDRLAQRREQFAHLIARKAGVTDRRIAIAFARIAREHFLGPGPWCISESGAMSASSNPEYVYQDIVIALAASQGITNGLPSLHARCINEIAPMPGERVVHVGAGTGYYTAVLAELVGPHGHVTALEIEPRLAHKAAENLRRWPNVAVHNENGTDYSLECSDVIYVNAGVSSPPLHWLDALDLDGRLLFPLVPGKAQGAMLMITRHLRGYPAKFIANARFYPCIGAQDGAPGLAEAFIRGDMSQVQAFRRDEAIDETCWYSANGWWLSKAAAMGIDRLELADFARSNPKHDSTIAAESSLRYCANRRAMPRRALHSNRHERF
ncbi:MAG: methyltransferase domain-containing protein [Casimicrobiaceae bacterium]